MKQEKMENTLTKQIRVYKSRHKKLKKEAVEKEISIADLIEEKYE